MSPPRPPLRIAPSILSADFSRLGDELRSVEESGADLIHVDVMDGHFVPNITLGPLIVEAVKKSTRLPIDVHLMIEHPERYLEAFVKAGANIISVHQEACRHLHRTIQEIRALGVSPAIALNPHTPPETLDYLLEEVDMVLVMSVNPGFGGQKYIPSASRKVARLRQMASDKGLPLSIEVDGGIAPGTAREVALAGADTLVAGSAIFGASDRGQAIRAIRSAAQGV